MLLWYLSISFACCTDMSAMQYIDYWVHAKKNDFCVICMAELHLVYGFFSVVKRIMGVQVSRLLSGGKECEYAFCSCILCYV